MLARQFSKLISAAQISSKTLLCSRVSTSYCLHFSSTQPNGDEIAFKTEKGDRIKGSDYLAEVRKQLGVSEDDEFSLPSKALEQFVAEYDCVQDESLEWKNKYQRALAETENVRKRGIKQTEDAKMFAIQGFCKDLLEVADILDLAVNSVKPDQLKTADKSLKDLHDGIAMTKTVLFKTFAKHGLIPVHPEGAKFDPNFHEAVFQLPASQAKVEPGHVAVVTKTGYALKDRPVRAAQVGVAIDG